MIGETLSHYQILEKLGEGGMGVIYRALDTRLERTVALKVLRPESLSNPMRRKRLVREAKAASSLNHPGIVTVYEIDSDRDVDFIAMEYLDGEPLSARLAEGGLPIRDVVRYARAIADALAAAHSAGIVHRDIKPANVMITAEDQVKVLDFGLAKQFETEPVDSRAETSSVTLQTEQGAVLGTAAYMSPEQAEGRPLDARSDIFSFGILVYELLCGRRPFSGSSRATLISSILRDPVTPPRSLRREAPREFTEIVLRCLKKDRTQRYASAEELRAPLQRCEEKLSAVTRLTMRRPIVAAAMVSLALAVGVAGWVLLRDDLVRFLERDTLAEITRLTETGELFEAFRLATEVSRRLPDDPEIRELVQRITLPISIVTRPPGAEVRIKAYASAEAPWLTLGETPLVGVRIPYALSHWRISKQGFEPFEGAPFGRPFFAFASGFELSAEGTQPHGMVRVPGGPVQHAPFPAVELTDYWLDRFEVTNRQFREFVAGGGYDDESLWTEPFVEDGRELPREKAMARLVDSTSRPGPAGWEFGAPDAGKGDYPVGGVSWYEAAAYCRFVGKQLPTLYHWYGATAQDQLSDILGVSNFGRTGPVPVGSRPGLGDFGTYDMAGNVKEWCQNEFDGRRYILGGSWGEPTYTFLVDADSRKPFSREPNHGFRCALSESPIDPSLLAPATPSHLVARPLLPVDDEIFAAYRGLYAYDRSELAAIVESVDDSSPHWREETVSFDAAYAGERVLVHVFLPRNVEPPYQPVVWFPGNDAFFVPPGGPLASPYLFDFIPRSGRALVYPVYKGMYERHVPLSFAPNEWRDMVLMWSKDLGRTIDYLETRQDLDLEKLAYYGFSAGAVYGPIFDAVDGRFRASVLLGGGLALELPPEANLINFAPRSRVPTLMINGEDDFIMPYELIQRPLLRLLGAPDESKRHVRLKGGHIPPDRLALIEEIVSWLDRHLGPVGQP